MITEKQMPKYKSHKEVWALKIKKVVVNPNGSRDLFFEEEEGYSPINVEDDYVKKHSPEAGGYYVVYKDGYKSFSPAEAFEGGNTIIAGDFKTRLIEERDELHHKITKLTMFLENKPKNDISEEQINLLYIQLSAMNTYYKIIVVRIENLIIGS